jgi:hypothetical protein
MPIGPWASRPGVGVSFSPNLPTPSLPLNTPKECSEDMSMHQDPADATGHSARNDIVEATPLIRTLANRDWLVRLRLRISQWLSAEFELRADRSNRSVD